MPVGMAELDCVAEPGREHGEEMPQCMFVPFRMEVGRELDEDTAELGAQGFETFEKCTHLFLAVAKAQFVGDQAGHFATETEVFRGPLHPMGDGLRAGRVVKGRVHLDGGKMPRVKFEPLVLREMGRIESFPPIVVAPCTGADFDFLRCNGIQNENIQNPAPIYLNRMPGESGFEGQDKSLDGDIPFQ
jgi:hypothetical protein